LTGATAATNRRRTTIRLTGRTSPRVFRFGWLALLLAIAVPAAACTGVSKPQGWAGPTLADDTLYASVEPGKIAALDPGDLTVKWVFPPDTDEGNRLDLEGVYGAPVVADGVVYFGAYDGNVYALDAEDGTPLWRFETAEPIIASLSFKDGTVYAGSTDGLLYAIDTTACTNACPAAAVRTFDTTSSIWASPLLVEDVIYMPAMSGRLYALDAGTLDEVQGFFFETDAGLTMDPSLASDDTLLVGGIDKQLFALDPRTGEQHWSEPFKGGNWFWGKPVVDGNTVYVADLDGNVHAVGLSDGRPQWDRPFKTEAAVRAALVLAGDTLVVVDRHGNAYGLNPDDGTTNWGPTLLGKTILSDPFLLERSPARSPTAEPSPVPAGASPSPTVSASARGEDVELLIVAQGGDVCRIDPADGSPAGAVLCTEVPL
jgi:outer membrane protein assembly factor BamB